MRTSLVEPVLSAKERDAINAGRWFSHLSASLRHDILRQATVLRLRDGAPIYALGDAPQKWKACAMGAVRMSSVSLTGRQTTLAYVEPGAWFGAMSVFLDEPRTRDAHAHGDTSLLCVDKASFRLLMSSHPEFCAALLRLQAHRTRRIYGLVEEISTLPLRARLAKQLQRLSLTYGRLTHDDPQETRIGLPLLQQDLAQLLGASRQRVNQELKRMERDRCIRIESLGLVIRDGSALQAIAAEA